MTTPHVPGKILKGWARWRSILMHLSPPKLLLVGYLSYMLIGWALLCLPFAQQVPVAALDALFIATSAVSTTGLVSVDPGSSFSLFGEIVILFLIQMGGLGYMTIGSFVIMHLAQGFDRVRRTTTKHAFNLPDTIDPAQFVKAVVIFTFAVEAIGAILLYFLFLEAGVDRAAWSAIFHSVSAFATAGFSLNSNSFEDFVANPGVNIVISTLSILGAMGFLIVVDFWRNMTGRNRHLGFTSKVIWRITLSFLIVGTLVLFVVEPSYQEMPADERLMASFFQVMTASTTVGFNTTPTSALAPAIIVVMFFLMIVGASPAGTGGGLKTTSFAALVGLVRSTLKGRDRIRYFKREIPLERLQTATASLTYYVGLLFVATFLLFLTDSSLPFDKVFFEAISAMGTVGLSMGITGDLTEVGKLVIIVLMTAGRVGILTFGMALAAHDETRDEEEDNDLVL
ncbi:TrkH family potassium uptake protein [Jannaschia aquimarina]|uniref:KtrB protein n=1 Tax=Jannaschia aquimarina TaxID=935700 RepID=A0A0D1D7R1_9RHOB|nr:potassium transporter TrkG [Jannaschia aquimarina]KIT16013.1 Ktr system potassium uptake protein B [Jannaschia aquimarina]SNT00078.1 trk system potassium uptake protein TrkH [Jannaschia aquimarina]